MSVYRVSFEFLNSLNELKPDHLDNNGRGFCKDDAEGLRDQLAMEDNVENARVEPMVVYPEALDLDRTLDDMFCDFVKQYREAVITDAMACSNTDKWLTRHNFDKLSQETVKNGRGPEIESRILGNTDADWIRLSCGDVYLFIYPDGTRKYQYDPKHCYGTELLEAHSFEAFCAGIRMMIGPVFIGDML